jgi:hypothetical protein
MNIVDQNLNDIRKLTKYQVRMINLQGGGSSNEEKRKVYQYKINDYSRRLSNNGYNVNKIMNMTQSGGSRIEQLTRELDDRKTAILSSLKQLKSDDDEDTLKDNNDIITEHIKKTKERFDKIGRDFGQYVTKNTLTFDEINLELSENAVKNTELSKQNKELMTKLDKLEFGDVPTDETMNDIVISMMMENDKDTNLMAKLKSHLTSDIESAVTRYFVGQPDENDENYENYLQRLNKEQNKINGVVEKITNAKAEQKEVSMDTEALSNIGDTTDQSSPSPPPSPSSSPLPSQPPLPPPIVESSDERK